jgi:hypothetical protein
VDMRVRAAVARAGYQVAVTTEEGLNGWQDPLALKRVNICDIDSLLEFQLKVATGKDYRQRSKAFLIKKGLYPNRAPATQSLEGAGNRGELKAAQGSSNAAVPTVPDSER